MWQIHDMISAFQHLIRETGGYFRARSSRTNPTYAMRQIAIAAVGLGMQAAIEAGHDPETIRAIERKTIKYIEGT